MIDAAIVRVAKARRLISHNELLAEVTQQILNFKAQPAQVRVFAYNERLGIGLACLVAWFAWALTHVSVNPIHNPPAPKTRQIKKRIAGLIEKVKCSCLISTLKTRPTKSLNHQPPPPTHGKQEYLERDPADRSVYRYMP